MPTITYTWNKHDRVESCSKCNALKGYSWTFINEIPTVLVHPQFGVVWDLRVDQSRAHGLAAHNCRCWLNIEVDDSDLLEDLERVERQTTDLNTALTSCTQIIQTFMRLLGEYS